MVKPSCVDNGSQPDPSNLHVWDSRKYSPARAFEFWSEEVSNRGMPWRTKRRSEDRLLVSVGTRLLEKGWVIRFSANALEVERTKAEIAASSVNCFVGGFVLSGSATLIQNGEYQTLEAGDFMMYDSSAAIKSVIPHQFETINLSVAKGQGLSFDHYPDFFRNLVIRRAGLPHVLRNCLYFLNDRIDNPQEVSAMYEAVLDMLPIYAGCFSGAIQKFETNALFREIVFFILQNIHDGELSTAFVARKFSVSERYLFKLFANHGMRFSVYLNDLRMENAEKLLVTSKLPIGEVAYESGFNDMSTFNRRFKAKYGCSPRQFRR